MCNSEFHCLPATSSFTFLLQTLLSAEAWCLRKFIGQHCETSFIVPKDESSSATTPKSTSKKSTNSKPNIENPSTTSSTPPSQTKDTQLGREDSSDGYDCWYTSALYDYKTPKAILNVAQEEDGTKVYKLLAITDMDEDSSCGNWTWRAVTRKAYLRINKDGTNVNITWINGSDRDLFT
ncbi:hypothetical protein KIN20_013627 [Parelaphostrongylus tenuis]|uniref:Uncharacterized protein n=1 Tax=Parelaphostrongylus tenuis TaxID=148309 RepID=A0AAD5QMR2_PARTN|nr:hypothetical protein KIN20_013627 [Parelaphostrongylus tenuis]